MAISKDQNGSPQVGVEGSVATSIYQLRFFRIDAGAVVTAAGVALLGVAPVVTRSWWRARESPALQPITYGITTMITWTFENGQLTARDGAGKVLCRRMVEEGIGRSLAALLNHAQPLGRLLVAG